MTCAFTPIQYIHIKYSINLPSPTGLIGHCIDNWHSNWLQDGIKSNSNHTMQFIEQSISNNNKNKKHIKYAVK